MDRLRRIRPGHVALAAIVAGLLVLLIRRGSLTTAEILFFACAIPSIILHELSHGLVALAFGDDTAKRAGRLTLNPLAHIDPIGTLLLPAALAVLGFPPFGYAKPVPVNVSRLRKPRNQSLLVSLAGPATNILIAAIAALVLRSAPNAPFSLLEVLYILGAVNTLLAAFNLVPIPPLDGSAVVERFLPARMWPGYLRLRQVALPVLLVLLLLLPQGLHVVLSPAMQLWRHASGLAA